MTNALPCIVCGAHLENVFPDSDNQPSEGTAFSTHGHYGSTFFDSFDGSKIEINVCDPCLVKNTDKIAAVPPPRRATGVRIPADKIAAAQLRVKLGEQLNDPAPDWVRRLAKHSEEN